MLQSLHNRLQGVIAWAIVILICITFAMWGIHNYLTSSQGENVVAKVNDIKITENDVNKLFNRMQRQQRVQMGAQYAPSTANDKLLRKAALQSLINSALLTNGAKTEGFLISPEQVAVTVQNLPAFQINHQFSEQRFQQVMMNLGYTPNGFLQDVSNRMLMEQVRNSFIGTAFALPYEIRQAIGLITEKRDFRYLTVKANHYKSRVNVTTAQAKAYYQKHLSSFKAPEQVSIKYLELSVTNLQKQLRFTPKQLKAYYQDNLSEFKTPAKWHVAQILLIVPKEANQKQIAAIKAKAENLAQQVKQGANFAELAKQHSQDIFTAKKGGDLGWITTRTKLGPVFLQNVEKLTKVGSTSPVIRTQYGFNIIKLLAIKPSKVQAFAQVKKAVKEQMASQKAMSQFADDSERLADLTYSNSDNLKVAANKLDLEIKTTTLFGRQGGDSALTKNPKIINAAFSNEVLKEDYNSNPIQLNKNTIVVLRVNKHVPAAVRAFSVVEKNIMTTLRDKKMAALAKKQGQNLLVTVEAERSIPNRYRWQSETDITRVNNKIDPQIIEQVFRIRLLPGAHHGYHGFSLDNGDYVIADVTRIEPGKVTAKNAMQLNAYRLEIERGSGGLAYQLYVKDLKSRAKIVLHKDSTTEGNS